MIFNQNVDFSFYIWIYLLPDSSEKVKTSLNQSKNSWKLPYESDFLTNIKKKVFLANRS